MPKFVKGQSGNIKGGPCKQDSMTYLIQQAALKDASDRERRDRKIKMINALYKKAEEGDVKAAKLILSYHDGLPQQDHNVEGSVNINIVKFGDNNSS